MNKVFVSLFSLVTFAQVGLAGDGVIMGNVRGHMGTVDIRSSNGARDVNATAHARFSFAMGMYTTENRVQVQSYSPDASGLYHFQKYNDQNQWQNCTVSVSDLGAGVFNPACH